MIKRFNFLFFVRLYSGRVETEPNEKPEDTSEIQNPKRWDMIQNFEEKLIFKNNQKIELESKNDVLPSKCETPAPEGNHHNFPINMKYRNNHAL